jgi:hypothetical protein
VNRYFIKCVSAYLEQANNCHFSKKLIFTHVLSTKVLKMRPAVWSGWNPSGYYWERVTDDGLGRMRWDGFERSKTRKFRFDSCWTLTGQDGWAKAQSGCVTAGGDESFFFNFTKKYINFQHVSFSKIFAPNLVRLSVKILFAELKHDSEGTVDTNTIKISRAIIVNIGYVKPWKFN